MQDDSALRRLLDMLAGLLAEIAEEDRGCGDESVPQPLDRERRRRYYSREMGEWKKAFWRWALAAGLAAAIWVGSSIPGGALPGEKAFSWQDKPIHAAVYFFLALLVARAMNVPRKRAWLVGAAAFAAATAFGAIEEVHQAFVPERVSTAWDALANGVGAGVAGLVWPAVELKWP